MMSLTSKQYGNLFSLLLSKEITIETIQEITQIDKDNVFEMIQAYEESKIENGLPQIDGFANKIQYAFALAKFLDQMQFLTIAKLAEKLGMSNSRLIGLLSCVKGKEWILKNKSPRL